MGRQGRRDLVGGMQTLSFCSELVLDGYLFSKIVFRVVTNAATRITVNLILGSFRKLREAFRE